MPFITDYEIVIKGRKEKLMIIYEMLSSMDGSILSISEIVRSNIDNLDYRK